MNAKELARQAGVLHRRRTIVANLIRALEEYAQLQQLQQPPPPFRSCRARHPAPDLRFRLRSADK